MGGTKYNFGQVESEISIATQARCQEDNWLVKTIVIRWEQAGRINVGVFRY